MSTTISFNRQYLRYRVNIQDCFSLQRKRKLILPVNMSPWTAGLARLLAERRGLTKDKLALLAPPDEKGRPFRPAMISKIAKGDSDLFLVSYLTRLAQGFTKFDRDKTQNSKADPDAPAVELWEFFVSDEQAAVLRERAVKTRQPAIDDSLVQEFIEFVKQRRQQIVERPERKTGAK